MEERVNQVLQRLNAEPKPLSARSLQENQPPIAVATSNLYELTGAGSISLSGAQSRDPNGDLLTFEWKQLSPSSPLADIASPTTEETTVRFAEIAADTTYRFLLTVKDGSLFDTSEVVVVQKAKVASTGEMWDRSKTYASPCHRVSWNGDEWDNQWWTSGNEPGADGTWGVWRKVGSTNNQCN
ncbi:hypothetical protein VIBHAR_02195 [Vibrio campbellii ATCC BAA-1116]|uniref:Chitin-binding type-3 domain-containing protein n=2 Tax=Vibrio campbellii TaxID=680 RepID=A7MVS7_VIBC1|nr:hypothetical protein VIBHAR_02195 [Vibrio campbellii ATCC BAA-1116]